jgi:hypothetical protein
MPHLSPTYGPSACEYPFELISDEQAAEAVARRLKPNSLQSIYVWAGESA